MFHLIPVHIPSVSNQIMRPHCLVFLDLFYLFSSLLSPLRSIIHELNGCWSTNEQSFNHEPTFASFAQATLRSENTTPVDCLPRRFRPTSKMGANLSSAIITHVDTSLDVISPEDALNTRNMALLWLGALQGIMMILATTLLVDRWRGPQGTSKVGFVSVVAALVLSAAWPVIFLYMMMAG